MQVNNSTGWQILIMLAKLKVYVFMAKEMSEPISVCFYIVEEEAKHSNIQVLMVRAEW